VARGTVALTREQTSAMGLSDFLIPERKAKQANLRNNPYRESGAGYLTKTKELVPSRAETLMPKNRIGVSLHITNRYRADALTKQKEQACYPTRKQQECTL